MILNDPSRSISMNLNEKIQTVHGNHACKPVTKQAKLN